MTAGAMSTTVQQRRLARILRRLRENAGLTIDQVAEKLELSPSTISRIETAQVGVRSRDVGELLAIYEVTGARRDELLDLARHSRQQPWWHQYRDVRTVPLAGLEADAASISQYSALVIPGLLQTREYATEVLRAICHDAPPEEIERNLRLRLQRQDLLTSKDPPDLWVVLDEAALRRSIGGQEVMQGQLQHVIHAAALSNVTVQVLPFSTGAHAGMDGEFTIFRYRDPADPDLVYIESTGGELYLETRDKTDQYRRIFDHLRATALNPVESIRALANVQQQLPEPERG